MTFFNHSHRKASISLATSQINSRAERIVGRTAGTSWYHELKKCSQYFLHIFSSRCHPKNIPKSSPVKIIVKIPSAAASRKKASFVQTPVGLNGRSSFRPSNDLQKDELKLSSVTKFPPKNWHVCLKSFNSSIQQ